MDAIVFLVEEGKNGVSTSGKEGAHITRNWVGIERPGFYGKFVPDNEVPDFVSGLSKAARVDYETWLRETTTTVIDTEMNVQLGEFTIKKHAIAPLDASIMQDPEFFHVFTEMSTDDVIQCAEVMNTTERVWVRLIGMGFDIQKWTPDKRIPSFNAKLPYKNVLSSWVRDIIDPWMAKCFTGIELYSSMLDHSGVDRTILYGYSIDGVVDPKDRDAYVPKTLKEVVVYKSPQVFHVFNVISHGRRFYRSLIFSSDPLYTLHDLPLNDGAYIGGTFVQSCGEVNCKISPTTSLVITRALSEEDDQVASNPNRAFQKFLPWYLLKGLIPAGLLSQYMFWQSPDDTVIGYMPSSGNSVTKSMLKIKLFQDQSTKDPSGNGNTTSVALISRVYVVEGSADLILNSTTDQKSISTAAMFNVVIDTTKPIMYLVSLMELMRDHVIDKNPEHQTHMAALKNFATLLLRLDSLSNVLAWSKTDPTKGGGIQIDLIEFPRIHLTFEKKSGPDGTLRYYCLEQSGLFLAGNNIEAKNKHLLDGLPHAVLLENEEDEDFVLLPATSKPTILKVMGDKYSYQLSLNRMDEQWLMNTGETGFFVYPVHSSGGFLSSKSVSSTLYLLLFRTLMRKFNEAFRLIETCVCDTALTPQEQQIYDSFCDIKDTLYPESHAMRLKLFFVSYGFDHVMPFKFNYREEMFNYISRISRISSKCRLSPEEEMFILQRIAELKVNDKIAHVFINRMSLIKASFNLYLEKFSAKSPSNQFTIAYPDVDLTASPLDDPVNLEILDTAKPQFKTWIGKFAISKYQKPEGSFIGVPTIQFLMTTLHDEYLDLRGKTNGLGFFFLYELMNSTMNMRLLPEDSSHSIGCVLMRTLAEDAVTAAQGVTGQSQPYALLRVMAEHPELSASMPQFEDKRMLKLPSIAGLDIFQSHIKNASQYVKGNTHLLQLDRIGYGIPIRFSPMMKVNGSPTPEQDLTNFRVGRRWISPRVVDSNCAVRTFGDDIPQLFGRSLSSYITSNDIKSFATQPLAVIGLSTYVELKSLSERHLQPVSGDSPLQVMSHQSSRSHIARTSVARLEVDIRQFSDAENSVATPVMHHIGSGDFEGRQNEIAPSIHLITSLLDQMAKLKAKDMIFVNAAITEVVAATNGDGVVAAKRNQNIDMLRHKLYQIAGLESTLVRCCVSFELYVNTVCRDLIFLLFALRIPTGLEIFDCIIHC